MRSWPAGQLGDDSAERGYSLFHLITPINPKKFLWRVALNAPVEHMSKGDPTVSTLQANSGDVSGYRRRRSLGVGTAAANDGDARHGFIRKYF